MPSSIRPHWTWASPPSASALVSSSTSPKRRARSRASSAAASSSAGSSTSQPIAGDGHPALLDARRLVGDEAAGPGEPGPARRQVAERGGDHVAEAADATAARRLSPAAVSSRTAVDRWARSAVDVEAGERLVGARQGGVTRREPIRRHRTSLAPGYRPGGGDGWHPDRGRPRRPHGGAATARGGAGPTGRAAAAPRRRRARRAPRQRRVPPLRAPPLRRAAARRRRLRRHRAAARRGLRVDRVGHVVPHGAQPDPVAVPRAHPGRGVRVAAVRDGAGRRVPARAGRAGRGRLHRQRAVELRQRRPPQRLGDVDGAHRRGRAARHAVGAGAHRGRRGARRVARRRHGGDRQRRLLDGRGLRPRPPHAPDEPRWATARRRGPDCTRRTRRTPCR